MKLYQKVLSIWVVAVSLMGASFIFPHYQPSLEGFLTYSIQLLLLIVAIYIVRHEPTRKNRFIFVNFAVFFSLSVITHIYYFVGRSFLSDDPYAGTFFYQYGLVGAYYLFLSLSIIYLTMDVLFRDFSTLGKYLVSLAIVGAFFGYYFHPYLTDPKHSYHTPDIADYKILRNASSAYFETTGVQPSPEVLASNVAIFIWKDGEKVGTMYPDAKMKRVQELYPYLSGSNYQILLYRPLYMVAIKMCVVCLGFILLFFGYLYMKDPPQGAYIEKVMFLFLIFCSMEILHACAFIKTMEWQSFAGLWAASQYITIAILLMIAFAFSMRLRFITSIKGEFYEQELATHPHAVTRWRDMLDNIVIEKFFNRKLVLGRLFVSPTGDKKPVGIPTV